MNALECAVYGAAFVRALELRLGIGVRPTLESDGELIAVAEADDYACRVVMLQRAAP